VITKEEGERLDELIEEELTAPDDVGLSNRNREDMIRELEEPPQRWDAIENDDKAAEGRFPLRSIQAQSSCPTCILSS